jgi:alkylhydroperoxidase/carboxymuconolactone decarboxylase family protein YurZ
MAHSSGRLANHHTRAVLPAGRRKNAPDEVLFGDVWEHPDLSKRDRSLVTVAVLAALYRTDEMRGHMRWTTG